jgi:rRNA processing/ribosome biogenesis
MSDSVHPLKTFLHLQLASDNAAVLNLPYVIRFLSPQHLQPSPHLQKWMARINSLIHSKDPGACWAGLSIACQTSLLSREVMLENARSWVGAALPLFSVRVSTHTLFSWISLCEETSPFADSKSCHTTSHTYFLGCTRYTGVPEANRDPECSQV